MITNMNTSIKLNFILNNDERYVSYVSSALFDKRKILISVFILKSNGVHI
jgi:hypothetical protein